MIKLRKLYEANRYCNAWKLKLHWDKLEWVNPRSKIKKKKTYPVSSIYKYINKGDRTSHWV